MPGGQSRVGRRSKPGAHFHTQLEQGMNVRTWLGLPSQSDVLAARSVLYELPAMIWSVAGGAMPGRLFHLPHDAAHNTLTPSGKVNRWTARLPFVPVVHPRSAQR